jgi:hypothetical protein
VAAGAHEAAAMPEAVSALALRNPLRERPMRALFSSVMSDLSLL